MHSEMRFSGVDAPSPSELGATLDLIARQQAIAERSIPSLGCSEEDLIADLEALEPTWTQTMRVFRRSDLGAIRTLHEAEFPDTYFTADQLLDRQATGDHTILVTERSGGRVSGYIAGQIQPDGDGYIDFLAVHPDDRGGGIGRSLVEAITRVLLTRSAKQRVCLTVRADRHSANALYRRLGFTCEATMVGYAGPRRFSKPEVRVSDARTRRSR